MCDLWYVNFYHQVVFLIFYFDILTKWFRVFIRLFHIFNHVFVHTLTHMFEKFKNYYQNKI